MKTTFLICLTSLAFALSLHAQSPTPAATPSPAPSVSNAIAQTPSPASSVSPSASLPRTSDDEDSIERRVKRNVRGHLDKAISGHNRHSGIDLLPDGVPNSGGDSADMAIAIVAIVFTTLLGAPVLMVTAIMFFSFLKARSLHRTVRLMVEKGQPVPPALFAPPPVVRSRSDMRRGVVLVTIGFGLIIFLAAVNGGFAGGEWSIGVIPLMIGFGYLLVWKLDARKSEPPSPPVG